MKVNKASRETLYLFRRNAIPFLKKRYTFSFRANFNKED